MCVCHVYFLYFIFVQHFTPSITCGTSSYMNVHPVRVVPVYTLHLLYVLPVLILSDTVYCLHVWMLYVHTCTVLVPGYVGSLRATTFSTFTIQTMQALHMSIDGIPGPCGRLWGRLLLRTK